MFDEIGGRTQRELSEHTPIYRRWIRPRLRSGELVAYVAESGAGAVLGSGAVWFAPAQPRPGMPQARAPYILSMFTEPHARGRGIAARIVRELLRLARSMDYPRVTLHASPQGRPVYRRLGFTRTWEMRRWLDPRLAARLGHEKGPRPVRPGGRRSARGRR